MRKSSRLPIIAFVLCAVLSTSEVVAAGWFRIDTGTGSGPRGGGGQGCRVETSGNFANANKWSCPIPDNSDITGYTSTVAFFQNANVTQNAFACVAFFNQTGGTCSNTGANNCPSGGVCSFLLNISAWQNNPGEFKFAVFDKMTDGSLMAGYVVWTTP